MSTKNAHIIQKQVIDITLPNANTAFEWEANKRRDFIILLNQELERSFDEFDKEGNYIVIEKLQLDLGDFSLNDLNTAMPGRLHSELHKTLQHHVDEAIEKQGYSDIKHRFEHEESKNEDRYYNGKTGQLEALCFFLKKGYLPWWGSELKDWYEDWLQKLSEDEIHSLKIFLTGNEDLPIRRLSTQFSDGFMNKLLKRMGITEETEQAWYWLKRTLQILQQKKMEELRQKDSSASLPFFNLPAIRTKYWLTWLNYVLGKGKRPGLYSLLSHQPEALKWFQQGLQNESLKNIDPLLSDKIPGIWKEEIFALQNKTTDNNQTQQSEENSLKETIPEANNELSSKELEANKSNAEDEDTFFTNDAGLILLHPFLLQLFTNCGWVENKSFVNAYTQTMAVYGLHYLATGEALALEHELTFPKLLSGIAWETPLEPVAPLNNIEKAACDELLNEVLKHWNALGNSSPDGLREAFLQRKGKLEYIHSGWRLSIEHKTLDILLNRLPWGISLVKLPWMKDMLTITWQ